MLKESEIKTDPILEDPEVIISQVIQKVFLLGMLVGRNQLQDDANAGASPIGQVLAQLQQQFDSLLPGTKDAAQSNSYSQFMKNIDEYRRLESFAKKEKEEKIKIPNQNLTPNDKKLNEQHDQIVRNLLDSLDEEIKQTTSNIVKETKMFVKK